MSFACGSSQGPSFSDLASKTKLSVAQISNFYSFFKKCSKSNDDTLTCEEFRNSLGVLGSKQGDFISSRLYQVISDPKTKKLTFVNYIMFLNLVNFGTKDEKLSHCFKFFDIDNKGFITNNDFVTIMLKLCEFISSLTVSQVLITQSDLEILYKDFMKKMKLGNKLNMDNFKAIIEKYPSFLDFYDIFNNNIQTDVNVNFKREQIDRFNELLEIIDELKDHILDAQTKPSSITLVTDDYIDDIMELKRLKEEFSKTLFDLNTNNNNQPNNAFASSRRRSSLYKDTSPLKLPLKDMDKDDSCNISDDSYESIISSRVNTEVINKSICETEQKIPQENGNNEGNIQFKIIKPFTDIKDQTVITKLKENGFNINNCLIITNKDKFLSYIINLHQSFSMLFKDLIPNKIKSKRTSIRIQQTKDQSFNFGQFVNMPFKKEKESEKGMIHFGNPNLELVINLMMGIKHSVSKIGASKSSILYPIDNDEIYGEINRFKYEQNNFDKVIECKFYDYAPKIFFNLRNIYGISNEDYLKSLGPENFLGNLIITKNKSLKELCSSGKSGSFFYFSYDSKYLLKTISEGEFNLFRSMLKDYYIHMVNNKKSLLQRFFGMHVCIFNEVKMFFVVMNNVFVTPLRVHYKYDLKGSTYQRLSRKTKEIDYKDYDYNVAMKDLDFFDRKENISLLDYEKISIVKQSIKDSQFLAQHNINDYSFLIGVHDQEFDKNTPVSQEDIILFTKIGGYSSQVGKTGGRKPFYEQYMGGMRSKDGKKVYFFGIIDIFTLYGGKKKMEHFVKSISQGKGISCKPPEEYSQRFGEFLMRIFDVKQEDVTEDSATSSNNQENGITNSDKGKVNFQDFNSIRDEETNK